MKVATLPCRVLTRDGSSTLFYSLEITAIWMPNVLNVNGFQINEEGHNLKIRLTLKHYSMSLT